MILTNKNRFPKKLLIVVASILIVVSGIFVYVYALHGNLFGWKSAQDTHTGTINYGPATSDQIKNGADIKADSKSGTSGSDQPPSPTPIPGSTKKSVSVTITAANQNGPILQIRALIGAVENTGTCTLTLTRTGQSTVTKTAGTQAFASTSTCKGFDVATSELSTGVWHINLTYDSSALTGSATKDVTIQ